MTGTAASAPVAIALAATVAAMLLIRIGWDRRRMIALIGWALAGVALMALAGIAGAWGLAVGAGTAMLSALALVLHAGLGAPARVSRPGVLDRPLSAQPRLRPLVIARRVAVFVLTVPAGFAAALSLSFGLQAAARRAGMVEANSSVSLTFLLPIAWSALMTWQTMQGTPRRMIVPPLAAAVIGMLFWATA